MVKVKVKLVDGGKMPSYKHDDDSCADCCALLPTESVTIVKGKRAYISLGFHLEIPEGWEGVVRPRSGNTGKGFDIGIGTLDAGFRGEVKACVINNTGEDLVIHNLDRICQLKIQKAEQAIFEEVEELSETKRGANGLGSTGIQG